MQTAAISDHFSLCCYLTYIAARIPRDDIRPGYYNLCLSSGETKEMCQLVKAQSGGKQLKVATASF